MGSSGSKLAAPSSPNSDPGPESVVKTPQTIEDMVIRISKKPHTASNVSTPKKELVDEVRELNDDEFSDTELDLQEQMREEKKLFKEASTWTPQEEQLFETLFLRGHCALLPSHWDLDFRGVPMPEVFSRPDEASPVIHALGNNFNATTALMHLIDLTADVRTSKQSGMRRKIPLQMKRGLGAYADWDAQDGGYMNRKTVPNIIVEKVNLKLKADGITEYMKQRMKVLAKLQRDFWRTDRQPDFWDNYAPKIKSFWSYSTKNRRAFKRLHSLSPMVKSLKRSFSEVNTSEDDQSVHKSRVILSPKRRRLNSGTLHVPGPTTSLEKRERPSRSPSSATQTSLASSPPRSVVIKQEEATEQLITAEHFNLTRITKKTTISRETPSTSTPPPRTPSPDSQGEPAEIAYRRQPPVVYGLFILNSLVFVLTADPAKGPNCPISFHAQADFDDRRQSVWNALTVAVVVCLARDDMVSRLDDFEQAIIIEDSDPDA